MPNNRAKKQKILKRYINLNAQIKRLTNEAEKFKSVEREDQLARIRRLSKKARRIRQAIQTAIDELEDTRAAQIMEHIYIDGLEIEQVAELMGYSIRQTYRIYSEAISKIKIKNQ